MKLHDCNSRYLLHGADGRRFVWRKGCRVPEAYAGPSSEGPCFAVVCPAGCDWEKELRALQCIPELEGSVVVLQGKKWLVEGVTLCCDKRKCLCNGVPRLKLTSGSSSITELLPVVRAAALEHTALAPKY